MLRHGLRTSTALSIIEMTIVSVILRLFLIKLYLPIRVFLQLEDSEIQRLDIIEYI